MYCMKCGRETKNNQIFCESCLADMASRPVKPGTPVQLPTRVAPTAQKKTPSRRKPPALEAQVGTLRKTVRWLALGMVLLIVLLFLSVSALVHTWNLQNTQQVIGQNYVSMDQTDGP